MQKITTVLCGAILLSTSVYAGGKVEAVTEVVPYAEIGSKQDTKKLYAGLGVSVGKAKSYAYGKDTVVDVTAKIGYNFSKYVGVEFRGSKGVSDGDQLGHDYSYGLYLKPQYPISKELSIYALAGYAQTKISFDNEVAFNGISNNYTTQNDFSFGAGLDYHLNTDWSLFFDAVRLVDKSVKKVEGEYAINVDALTFGLVYHF
jgi:opacity protein-like surface antigen